MYGIDPLGITLEAAPGADLTTDPDGYAWQDLTRDLFLTQAISDKVGSDDEQTAGTSELTWAMRNSVHPRIPGSADGRYSADNPESDLYPYVDVGLPVRLSLDVGSGAVKRMVQYVSAVGEEVQRTPVLSTVAFSAAGLFRRLGQGSVLRSALTRAQLADGPIAAWPVEDLDDATQAASSLPSGFPMTANSAVAFADVEGPPGGASYASISGGGRLSGDILGCSTSGWRVEWIANTTALEGCFPVEVRTSGTATSWRMIPPNALDPTLYVQARLPDTTLALNLFVAMAVTDYADTWHHYALVAFTAGTKITGRLYLDGVLVAAATSAADLTLGAALEVIGNSPILGISTVGSVGSFAVYNSTAAPTAHAALDGYAGELGGVRWARLCDEEGVPYTITGTSSTAMGPQGRTRLLDQLREIEATDHGIADDSLGRADYRTGNNLYNQTAVLTIDAANRELFLPVAPVRDDQKMRNLIVASRPSGSEATVSDPTHIAKYGSYDDSKTVNVATDGQLKHHAGWFVHLGTQPGKRFPQVTLDLRLAPQLAATWLTVRRGDRITILNPPRRHSRGPIDLIFVGWTEVVLGRRKGWVAIANAVAYWPYEVFVIETGSGNRSRLSSRLAKLGAAVESPSTTSLTFTTTGRPWITSAAFPAQFPIDVEIGGEEMRVTAITGATSPQTATVERGRNDVRLTYIAANTPILLRHAPAFALESV